MLSFLLNAIKIIFLLGFLVLIHEGGHFIVAKLCKVKVNEFAIGFGPTILSKTKGDTKYAIHLIPLGGFVSMEGEEERSDVEGSFSNASVLKRIAIVFAGGAVNVIFGLLVYFILISSLTDLHYGFINTGNFIVAIFNSLKEIFTGNINVNQMAGIVGISDIVIKTSGIYEYIYMLAIISLSLGITNLLPFPPLDGGKILIYVIEAVRKKPMKEKIEIQLQILGFAVLIVLSIYVTYNDILRII